MRRLANVIGVEERLVCLRERFLERAEAYENPMIIELIDDYRETFRSGAPSCATANGLTYFLSRLVQTAVTLFYLTGGGAKNDHFLFFE